MKGQNTSSVKTPKSDMKKQDLSVFNANIQLQFRNIMSYDFLFNLYHSIFIAYQT